jgi:hypothetical protein
MGIYQDKINNLIKYSISTFQNNNTEDVQTNARKTLEAFCKIIIFHHYGEEIGNDIIHSKNQKWNEKLKVRNKNFGFNLSMLLKVVLQTDYKDVLSKVKKDWLERHLNVLIFKGNSAAHESTTMNITRDSLATTKSILKEILIWLFDKYLKIEIPPKLIPYINRYDIFLSYRHSDEVWIEILKENLEAHGYSLYVDSYNIIGGKELEYQLKQAINRSKCAVIVSSAEQTSTWIKTELEFMKERQHEDSEFKIIPIVTDGSSFPLLKELVYVDFQPSYRDAFNQLLCAIEKFPPSKNYIKGELKLPSSHATTQNCTFVKKVIEELEQERLVKLFFQEYTNITQPYKGIKEQLKSKFKENTSTPFLCSKRCF